MPASQRTQQAQLTRQRILDVATRLFLSNGYAQTSLENVAEVAETTKPTIYSHFQSKQGLFKAVVDKSADERIQVLNQMLIPSEDPKADLIDFGDKFLPRVLSEKTQRWDRLAATESINHPEVGEVFYQAGPARLLKRLADYLKAQDKAGALIVPRPERAAEQLIGLMLGVDMLRTQIGKKSPSATTLKKRCREAVAVFLAAYGVTND